MFRIQNLTNDSKQKQTLTLPDGTQITIAIYYSELQQGWFITSLSYLDFTLNGLRITNIPNMLYQFRNRLPFGLMCRSNGAREPFLQDDFLSGYSELFVLTEAEVEEYTEFLNGEV